MFRNKLVTALRASGYHIETDDDRLTSLVDKLEYLQGRGHYNRLISNIFSVNDKANLKSLVLEATFAYQFEISGISLRYEVVKRLDDETSVDFFQRLDSGEDIFIEMRLVQQRNKLTTLFEEQLHNSDYFGVVLDGNDDRADTLRLQCLILEKAVNSEGQIVKFRENCTNNYNIVAIEVSELHLGMIDEADCMLTVCGDPVVPEIYRRGMFGLFQKTRSEYPQYIQEISDKFEPFRTSVHGVLFLRKVPAGNPINFCLEYIFIHNPELITIEKANEIACEFKRAMEVWVTIRK